jgi:hypothetical protein
MALAAAASPSSLPQSSMNVHAGYRGWLPTEGPEEFNSLAARSSDRLNCAGYIFNAHTGESALIHPQLTLIRSHEVS